MQTITHNPPSEKPIGIGAKSNMDPELYSQVIYLFNRVQCRTVKPDPCFLSPIFTGFFSLLEGNQVPISENSLVSRDQNPPFELKIHG